MNIENLRREVVFEHVRSRGPGGQNVNKVSSSAVATWDFMSSAFLREDQKQRLGAKLANRINRNGELQIRSDEFRDLNRNKERCLEKLLALVKEGLHVAKARKKTKPTFSSKVKRQESKKRRSETKAMRRKDW